MVVTAVDGAGDGNFYVQVDPMGADYDVVRGAAFTNFTYIVGPLHYTYGDTNILPRDANDIDGVRILFGDGWGLIRASNTQPVLVLRFEAQTPERLQAIQEIVLSKLREIAPEVEVPL